MRGKSMGNSVGWIIVGFIALLILSHGWTPFSYNQSPYGYPGYYGNNCFLGNIFGCGYSNYFYNPQFQLTVNTNPSLPNVATGGGSFTQGGSATFSVSQNIVQQSAGTRYVFTGWTGDYVGTGLSGSVIMTGPKTVTANFQLQYYLTVSITPATLSTPGGSGWYNASSTVNLQVPSSTITGTPGSRLMFGGWRVDGSTLDGLTAQITMNAPHTAVAQFKQQYYLRVISDRGTTSGEGWYDAGSTAQVSVTTPESSTFGVKDVFAGWNGDVQSGNQYTTVQMDGPKTVTANWRTDATLLYLTIGAGLLLTLLGLVMVVKRHYPQYLATLRQTFPTRQ
jgi:uncharacterized repeat protein (TIGR02543 family)